jgi:hypothetical protein
VASVTPSSITPSKPVSSHPLRERVSHTDKLSTPFTPSSHTSPTNTNVLTVTTLPSYSSVISN